MTDSTQNAAYQASSLREQVVTMHAVFGSSPVRRTLTWLAGGIFLVIIATAVGQVLLNRWNQPFYDAIQRRNLPAFLHQLVVFAAIAGGLLVLNIGQQWLNQRLQLRLREALTLDLIDQWMRPGRAFRVAHAGAIGVNPDQRMQQDASHLSELTIGLGVGLLQAMILLVSFVGVLWELSAGFAFHIGGHAIAVPGYMVWAAFIYAGTASWLSWLVGRPLIGLDSERYSREAELRFSMVRVNEHIDAIALARGETGEKRRLISDLGAVLAAMMRIYSAQINLAWVADTYGWITTVAPILVAAPVYFAGDISFGGLMMAVGAFNQVHSSLRWFVNNFGGIADWRATLMRVTDFRLALEDTDRLHDTEQRIEFAENDDGCMTFDRLEIVSPVGCTKLSEDKAVIKPGERVMVTGDPTTGKTLFFRAVAGLWPWGSGRIGMPSGATPVFMPRTPYFAPGTLREVLDGDENGSKPGDDVMKAVLGEVGLGHLGGSLDREARWDRELSEDEQRLLAFAALALHKPDWVVIDEALDTFDGATVGRVLALLHKHLPKSAILNVGRGQHNLEFFPRTLAIVKDTGGKVLKPPRMRMGAIEPPPRRTAQTRAK